MLKGVKDMKVENAVKLGLLQSPDEPLQRWMFSLTFKCDTVTKSIKYLKGLIHDLKEDVHKYKLTFLISDVGYIMMEMERNLI